MLGFGFNKTKVLASAERYVQQGKLQNAIAEYEKVTKEDPKDITVLNTIGDLYARLGQVDSALNYFRKVGDHYASEGFTVKAIAMYKKLTKLNPSAIDSVQKLAELYTQQGLYNDARQQFMVVAENHVRANALDEASRVFQKMLELDPENAALQSKLADIYLRIGKKDDAKNIFLRAAESLYQRGTVDAAAEALRRVLGIDATNVRALQLKAQIAQDSGDSAAAVAAFNSIPDLDSRPDALRSLLNAYVQLGQIEDAAPCAKKLLNVHHDISGMKTYADMLLASGKIHEAIGVYEEFSDQLIAANGPAVVQALNGYILRVKDDPNALDCLNSLFQKAGDTSHGAEIMELLAHACVQKNDFARARDLYKELSAMEPENPLHLQNYKQILAKMGEESTVRDLSPEEGSQALMVEELETSEVLVEQNYPDVLATAILTALTEADLFESYNVPKKALPPLEAVLPRAPQDVRLNQRLAALYARMGRPADAAQRCAVLEKIFSAAGLPQEAMKYGEMAAKYAEAAGTAVPHVDAISPDQLSPASVAAAEPAFSIEPETSIGKVEEYDFDSVPAAPPKHEQKETVTDFIAANTSAPAVPLSIVFPVPVSEAPVEQAAPIPSRHVPEFAVPPEEHGTSREIDLSDEWESMLQAQEATLEPPPDAVSPQIVEDEDEEQVAPPAEPVGEIIPEPVVETVVEPAPEPLPEPTVEPAPARSEVDDLLEEIEFCISESMWSEAASAVDKLGTIAPEHPELAGFCERIAAATIVEPPVEPRLELATPSAQEFPTSELPVEPEPQPALAAAPATEMLEAPLDISEDVLPAEEPVASFAQSSGSVLDDFVADLDASLGEDFAIGGKPAPALIPTPVPTPVPHSAVAASVVPATSATMPQAAAVAPAFETTPEPAPEPLGEGSSLLNDLFEEFKEDVEGGGIQDEDPETHYNLGVAFKEMGLLDEAIGELQKVCQSIEHGRPFSQAIQAYTWLASCFVEKGVPEASVKWYQKALTAAADEETRTAIHYELAAVYESSGNKAQALHHFMEVYTTNIDFRDVAERIRILKQS